VNDIALNGEILINEIGRMSFVHENTFDLSCGKKHLLRTLLGEEFRERRLIGTLEV
jgi:hypothetical protein